MQITLNTKPTDDPHDVLVVASDASPVAPAEQADPITPTEEALSRLAQSLREAPVLHEAPTVQALPEPEFVTNSIVPPVDTSFRPVVDDVAAQTMVLPPTAEARPLRGFATALLFALVASGAAMAWQVFGDTAIQAATRWMPQHVLAALPLKPSVAAEPASSPAADAAATPAASPPPVVNAADGAAPAHAAAAADPTPSLRAMGQQIEELKASIEQLKASQQQMSRELAMATERATEPNLTPRPPAPRPAVARVRNKPVPSAPTQTAAAPRLPPVAAAPAPYVPRQPEPPPAVAAQPQLDPPVSSAPRPPMPIQ